MPWSLGWFVTHWAETGTAYPLLDSERVCANIHTKHGIYILMVSLPLLKRWLPSASKMTAANPLPKASAERSCLLPCWIHFFFFSPSIEV